MSQTIEGMPGSMRIPRMTIPQLMRAVLLAAIASWFIAFLGSLEDARRNVAIGGIVLGLFTAAMLLASSWFAGSIE